MQEILLLYPRRVNISNWWLYTRTQLYFFSDEVHWPEIFTVSLKMCYKVLRDSTIYCSRFIKAVIGQRTFLTPTYLPQIHGEKQSPLLLSAIVTRGWNYVLIPVKKSNAISSESGTAAVEHYDYVVKIDSSRRYSKLTMLQYIKSGKQSNKQSNVFLSCKLPLLVIWPKNNNKAFMQFSFWHFIKISHPFQADLMYRKYLTKQRLTCSRKPQSKLLHAHPSQMPVRDLKILNTK